MRRDLAQKLGKSLWSNVPLWAVVDRVDCKNAGMVETNLLSLSYGRIVRRDIGIIGGLQPASYETYNIIEPGDTVMRMTDLQNDQRSIRTGLAKERGIITSAYVTVRPIEDQVESRFLAAALRAYDINKTFYEMGAGVRQTLKFDELAQLPIPLPPIETQRRIADYLDRETSQIDATIDKLGDLQETLLARKVEVIRNSTQLSASGKSWDTVPTAHLFGNIGSGTTPKAERHYTEPGEGVPWVTTSELRESVIRSTSKNVTTEALESVSSLTLHPKGSVLIAMYGATIGRLGVLGVDATMNQACCAFSLPIGIDMRFFYYTLWGQRDDIIRLAVGGGQPNISQNMLRRWRIPLPPLDEQRRIADHLDDVTSKIDSMLSRVAELKDLLTERRAALITDVVTGRKEVA